MEVKCPACGTLFVDYNALRRHAKVHEPVPAYKCPACERGEVKAQPREGGQWEWACTICGSDFGSNTPKPLLD